MTTTEKKKNNSHLLNSSRKTLTTKATNTATTMTDPASSRIPGQKRNNCDGKRLPLYYKTPHAVVRIHQLWTCNIAACACTYIPHAQLRIRCIRACVDAVCAHAYTQYTRVRRHRMRACVYAVYARAYTPHARVRIRHIRAIIIGRGYLVVSPRCRSLTLHYYIKYRSVRINALAQEAEVLTPSSSSW